MPKRICESKKTEVIKRIKAGQSVAEASNSTGITRAGIYKWLEEAGIEPLTQKRKNEALLRQHIEGVGKRISEGDSAETIAISLNVSVEALRDAFVSHFGVNFRDFKRQLQQKEINRSPGQLTSGQLRLLTAISSESIKLFTSEFANKYQLARGSISKNINVLTSRNLVYRDADGYWQPNLKEVNNHPTLALELNRHLCVSKEEQAIPDLSGSLSQYAKQPADQLSEIRDKVWRKATKKAS